MKISLVAIIAVIAIPASAQTINDDELRGAMQACANHRAAVSDPKHPALRAFDQGWEVCADITSKWQETERAQQEKEIEEQKSKGDSLIRSIEPRIKRQ